MKTHQASSRDQFKTGLIVSAGAHALIAALFLYRMIFPQKIEMTDLPAIRVDIVALPEKDQSLTAAPPVEVKKPEPAPAPTPTKAEAAEPKLPAKPAVDSEAIQLKKAKQKQTAALNKLKSLEALEKIKNDLKQEKIETERKKAEELFAQARKIKGNVISPGTELQGLQKLQHEEYRNLVDRHVKPHWQLPEWLARKSYVALILVKINAKGELVSSQIVKSSGNPDFDASATETIEKSIPLPAPPAAFVAKMAEDGLLIEFGNKE